MCGGASQVSEIAAHPGIPGTSARAVRCDLTVVDRCISATRGPGICSYTAGADALGCSRLFGYLRVLKDWFPFSFSPWFSGLLEGAWIPVWLEWRTFETKLVSSTPTHESFSRGCGCAHSCTSLPRIRFPHQRSRNVRSSKHITPVRNGSNHHSYIQSTSEYSLREGCLRKGSRNDKCTAEPRVCSLRCLPPTYRSGDKYWRPYGPWSLCLESSSH